MIRNHFWVIDILIEKIVIGNTQPADNIARTFPEGFLKVLKFETCREISGDQYKNWWFYEKIIFQK